MSQSHLLNDLRGFIVELENNFQILRVCVCVCVIHKVTITHTPNLVCINNIFSITLLSLDSQQNNKPRSD